MPHSITDAAQAELSEVLADVAAATAVETGGYLREHFASGALVEEKAGYQDVVTQYDRHAEKLIVERLLAGHPDSTVVGEEDGVIGDGAVRWYVDPIDGTSNFAAGIPLYCVSIGAVSDGALVAGAIYDPEHDELFRASSAGATLNGTALYPIGQSSDATSVCLTGFPYEGGVATDAQHAYFKRVVGSFRGVRRLGSSALGLAYVAAGRGDVAFELNANPWDIAAGLLLVEQAGGRYIADHDAATPLDNAAPWLSRRYVAAGGNFRLDDSTLSQLPPAVP